MTIIFLCQLNFLHKSNRLIPELFLWQLNANNIKQKIIKKKLAVKGMRPGWGLRSSPIPNPSELTRMNVANKIKTILLLMSRLFTFSFAGIIRQQDYSGAVAASLIIPVAIKCLLIFFQYIRKKSLNALLL